MVNRTPSLWALPILSAALKSAFMKFSVSHQLRNPVMFCVYVGALLTTIFFIHAAFLSGEETSLRFIFSICILLWLTLYFGNFAEALAEGRGKAQAQALQNTRSLMQAKQLEHPTREAHYNLVPSTALRTGDYVLVEAGDFIPGDGEVVEGIASVNESAVTGESAPVIRESGGDRSTVTGGTLLISDWLIIRIVADPGNTFIDKMIDMVEEAKRKKTPNELALTILLATLTLMFLMICASLLPFSMFSVLGKGAGQVIPIPILVALFVCLAPTTVGALLSAIGIAGMNRMIQANIIAMSGRAVEAAGDVDILLLDKTGTITFGDRQATALIPLLGVKMKTLVEAAYLSSLADQTAEGRSIIRFAVEQHAITEKSPEQLKATWIPFSAHTRMSGINYKGHQIRKGSPDAIKAFVTSEGGAFPEEAHMLVNQISNQGATALVVAKDNKVLGVIELKDQIKSGIAERFSELRAMRVKTIMMTGDHNLTAAAIAAEAGVDDFFAETTPEDKLILIRRLQATGHLVAMSGDGTNDAPALAQADVAVAMNTGTQAAKEAANLIDLDSDPTKLINVIEIGKQMLMTRGALTTFSVSNDLAKYFAILPAAFANTYPALSYFNIMNLSTPENAILSTVIFNALSIVLLIPLALLGVKYKPSTASHLLKKHALIYGIGGLMTPFFGIKLIDRLLM